MGTLNIIHSEPSRQTRSILVAEDHSDSREAIRTLLEAFGYTVHVAVNGRQAIAMARSEQPDLIVMDIMMPEVDGIEATRAIREMDGFKDTPILAVTAMEGSRELSRDAGCTGHISKPINVQAFLDTVRRWAPTTAIATSLAGRA